MHVIATAGHVDHGKSALVKALTGTDPDRLGEEQRRGLSIQLGYAWTVLEGAGAVAFVDVPGHERFVSTMLAGVGPVPAVLFVVAADDPWMPQAAEHLAALHALDVGHGVVAVTRSDLADPAPAIARVRAEVGRTSLADAPVVAVSSRTGAGLAHLRGRLVAMVRSLPDPDPDADVRLWVDRRFTIGGAGTVVTGTLPAGTVSKGDTLSTGSGTVRVRGLQALGESEESVSGVARVALNVTGDVAELDRASTLTTPEAFQLTGVLDVRVHGEVRGLPTLPMLHLGALSTNVRCRPLADDLVRLSLDRPLPLRVGDRALLRDPGSRAVWGVRVLDPAPPALRRRGAARDRARVLTSLSGEPDLASEIDRRELVEAGMLHKIGVPVNAAPSGVVAAGRWLMSAERADRTALSIAAAVAANDRAHPLSRGLQLTALADSLALPSTELVAAAVRAPLTVSGGRVLAPAADALPPDLEAAVAELAAELATNPFAAPTADRLRDLGLDGRRIAAAGKVSRLLRLAPGIVLLPGADRLAVEWLSDLPSPFTASAARSRLRTSRRVVLPLLEHLDRTGLTRRLPDDRRVVVDRGVPART